MVLIKVTEKIVNKFMKLNDVNFKSNRFCFILIPEMFFSIRENQLDI